MPTITRVRQVELGVADVGQALAFYRDALGLAAVAIAPSGAVTLPVGKSAIVLQPAQEDRGVTRVCFDAEGGPAELQGLPADEHFGLPIAIAAPTEPLPAAPGPVECLDHLVISSGDSAKVAAHFRDVLGLEIKRTFARPGTGNHLEFGKLVDVVLEFAGPPEPREGEVKAAFWGIVFTVNDIDAVVATCRAAGYETTDPRPAVQPGAKIAAVKRGTGGVPFALIQYNAIAA
jgi:catechol 2,3-dioxygenase-like lactoylglutathione lyase family enzyme